MLGGGELDLKEVRWVDDCDVREKLLVFCLCFLGLQGRKVVSRRSSGNIHEIPMLCGPVNEQL